MKRKLSLTLKTLSALLVSLALVLSTAGPASAETGYSAEKCTGSKDVCNYWGSSEDGTWRFSACYKKKVSVRIQVKSGSAWKNVKGASTIGKKSSESCRAKYPYLASVEVLEKSKGNKNYRLVLNEKGKSTFYTNFKVKVVSYEFDSSDPEGGTPSPSSSPNLTYSKETYDYIWNALDQLKSTSDTPFCWMAWAGTSETFQVIAGKYSSGAISEALAISQTDAELRRLVSKPYSCFMYK
jgi:hypothetical protein